MKQIRMSSSFGPFLSWGFIGVAGYVIGVAGGAMIGRPSEWPSIASVYDFFKDQGSFIAGLLAVGAAYFTIRAMRQTAWREIAAANRQTRAAQRQTEMTLLLERRRYNREGYAFCAMVAAAARIVLEESTMAQSLLNGAPASGRSEPAYRARRAVSRTGFDEIKTACTQLGGELTDGFLALDSLITSLVAGSREVQVTGVSGQSSVFWGELDGAIEELRKIDLFAHGLLKEASIGVDRCKKFLIETQDKVEGLIPQNGKGAEEKAN